MVSIISVVFCFYAVQSVSSLSRVARYTPSLTYSLPSPKIQNPTRHN
jgi:hypothetical protein